MRRWLLILALLLSMGPLWIYLIDKQIFGQASINPVDAGLVIGGIGIIIAGVIPARSSRERVTRFLLAVALLIASITALGLLVANAAS